MRTARISEKLVEKLRKLGDIPASALNVRFERHYPGHWQRSAGAWVWEISWMGASGVSDSVGSSHTARECLKAKSLIWMSGGYHPEGIN